jgi:hypothetical protein
MMMAVTKKMVWLILLTVCASAFASEPWLAIGTHGQLSGFDGGKRTDFIGYSLFDEIDTAAFCFRDKADGLLSVYVLDITGTVCRFELGEGNKWQRILKNCSSIAFSTKLEQPVFFSFRHRPDKSTTATESLVRSSGEELPESDKADLVYSRPLRLGAIPTFSTSEFTGIAKLKSNDKDWVLSGRNKEYSCYTQRPHFMQNRGDYLWLKNRMMVRSADGERLVAEFRFDNGSGTPHVYSDIIVIELNYTDQASFEKENTKPVYVFDENSKKLIEFTVPLRSTVQFATRSEIIYSVGNDVFSLPINPAGEVKPLFTTDFPLLRVLPMRPMYEIEK